MKLVRRGFQGIRSRLWPLLALVVPAVAAPARAEDSSRWHHDFRSVTLGLAGGFQLWSLSNLEEALRTRATELAIDGYAIGEDSFAANFAYGLEIQLRLSEAWFARAQFDWTRLRVEDRDRAFLQFLGGSERAPISLTYVTRVQTRPVLGTFGVGRAWRGPSLRLGLAGGLVIAPLKVVDEIGVYYEADTVSEVEATGTGLGGELTASLDWYTDVNMTLYLELFGRTGRTEVDLKDAAWDSTILPGTRSVDLDAVGLRLGFRWI